MTEQWESQSSEFNISDKRMREDLTGRDRLVSNVVFSWAGHFVFVIAGFILPRMIDRRLGQELLGVWDFAWSIVSYFNLVELGIGGSVNRYVARFRMAGDVNGLNRTVSSASFLLSIAGTLVFVMTIAVSLLLPQLFGTKLGENIHEAQWVILFLGADIGIQIALGAFGGVLMGCHRWKLLNLIAGARHAVVITGMITALVMGSGLGTMSLTFLIGNTLSRVVTMILAYRICMGLQLKLSMIGRKMIKELYLFAGKSLISLLSKMFLSQTTSVLIVAYLGPAALALFTRPFSLIRHMDQLVQKIAAVTRPTASSLQSTNNRQGIQELLQKSVRYSFYIVMPMLLVVFFFGDAIMQFWMGPRYANWMIPAILAIGFLADLGQSSAVQILAGLNAHGRAGFARLIASVCSIGFTVLVLGFLKWGLAGAAIAVSLPITLMNVVYLPQLVCRRVGLSVREYFLSILTGPVLHVLPFAACLAIARFASYTQPLIGLVWGGSAGAVLLAVTYWRHVLPDTVRQRVLACATARKLTRTAEN
jgi:O-antigen/teichoic acid export membrane protein